MARVLVNLDLEVLPDGSVRRVQIIADAPGKAKMGYSTVLEKNGRCTPGWATGEEIVRAMNSLEEWCDAEKAKGRAIP